MNIFLEVVVPGVALVAATGAGFVLAGTPVGERLLRGGRRRRRRVGRAARRARLVDARARDAAGRVDSLVVAQLVSRASGAPAGVPSNRRLREQHGRAAVDPVARVSVFGLNQYDQRLGQHDQRLTADERRSRRAHPSAAWRRCAHVARKAAPRRGCLRPIWSRAYPNVICETHWVHTPADAQRRAHQWVSELLLSPTWAPRRPSTPDDEAQAA